MWAVACVVIGCASRTAPSTPSSASTVPAAASVLSGRMNVDVAADDGGGQGRNMTAGFELHGTARDGRLDLTAPTGSILARAAWSPGDVVLHSDGRDRRYADLDGLTADMLGESLPVAAMFDWLRGRPWPEAGSTPLAPPAGPGFVQLGWSVDLGRYADGTVIARRARAPAVAVRIKLDAVNVDRPPSQR